MSNTFDPSNPVILFGDVGPDIIRLSQIYDPDSDEYALSKDENAVAGKTYYTRTYADKTVTFTEVTNTSGGHPESAGWYELNLGGTRSTGKYVPAEDSLVVVDFMTEDYDEYSILIVDSVDEVTLKSTLVPHNCGADGSTTARALRYGNGDYQLYFNQDQIDPTRTELVPDRKLMLYGSRYYMYKLVRNGVVISTPFRQATEEEAGNGLVPYVSTTGALTTLSTDPADDSYYPKFAGKTFGKVTSSGFASFVVPGLPVVDEEGITEPTFVPTLDGVYKSGRTYHLNNQKTGERVVLVEQKFKKTNDATFKNNKRYYSYIDPSTGEYQLFTGTRTGSPKALGYYEEVALTTTGTVYTYTAGAVIGSLFIQTNHKYDHFSRTWIESPIEQEVTNNPTGWIESFDDNEKNVFYPGACWLKAGFSIQSGETVRMEVYEVLENSTSLRLIMNVVLNVREGDIISGAASGSKVITKFDVDNDPAIKEDPNIWKIGVGDKINVVTDGMEPTLTFEDGSTRIIPVDDPGLFVYGLENVSTANSGVEFKVLFKYFPAKSPYFNGVEYFNSNYSKGFLTCTKVVKVVEQGDIMIRKISIIPAWDYESRRYKFNYLVYDNSFKSPVFMGEIGSATLADVAADTAKSVELTHQMYLDDMGIARQNQVGVDALFGYIQHAVLGLYIHSANYKNAVYTQALSIQLQEWDKTLTAAKWLIGSYDNEGIYRYEDMPYGNPTATIRPYIQFDWEAYKTDPVNNSPYRIGTKFVTAKEFTDAFYEAAKPPTDVVEEGGETVTITPTHFVVRSMETRDDYICLRGADDSDYPLPGIVYCDAETGVVIHTRSDTIVTPYKVKVTADNVFYTIDTQTGEYYQVDFEVGHMIDVADKSQYFIKQTVEINSGYIPISTTNDDTAESATWLNAFRLLGASSAKTVGGARPVVVGDDAGTMVMGVVVVEFVAFNNDTGAYQHLYGVPVEVRFPYQLTSDVQAQAGKTYYVCTVDEADDTAEFSVLPIAVGDYMPSDVAVWEQY